MCILRPSPAVSSPSEKGTHDFPLSFLNVDILCAGRREGLFHASSVWPFPVSAAECPPSLWTGGGWQLILIRSENGGHSRLVNGLQDDPDSADNETESEKGPS